MKFNFSIYEIKRAISILESEIYPGASMAITNLTKTKKAYIVDLDIVTPTGVRTICPGNIYKKKMINRLIFQNYAIK